MPTHASTAALLHRTPPVRRGTSPIAHAIGALAADARAALAGGSAPPVPTQTAAPPTRGRVLPRQRTAAPTHAAPQPWAGPAGPRAEPQPWPGPAGLPVGPPPTRCPSEPPRRSSRTLVALLSGTSLAVVAWSCPQAGKSRWDAAVTRTTKTLTFG